MQKKFLHICIVPDTAGSVKNIRCYTLVILSAIGLMLTCGCQTQIGDKYSVFHLPTGSVNIELVKIPAGKFKRYPAGKSAVHESILQDYRIGKYEVTQGQFAAIMGYDPSQYRKGINTPVTDVNWYEAKDFCNRLNTLFQDRLPAGYHFDLPTVAQWEYACSAGTDMPTLAAYYENDPGIAGWTYLESPEDVQPVGLKQPNAWGIHDMHGNVIELCRNLDEPFTEFYNDGTEMLKANCITVCGWGIFHEHFRFSELTAHAVFKSRKKFDMGFRVALVPIPPPAEQIPDQRPTHE